jgi:hypothetical protein
MVCKIKYSYQKYKILELFFIEILKKQTNDRGCAFVYQQIDDE